MYQCGLAVQRGWVRKIRESKVSKSWHWEIQCAWIWRYHKLQSKTHFLGLLELQHQVASLGEPLSCWVDQQISIDKHWRLIKQPRRLIRNPRLFHEEWGANTFPWRFQKLASHDKIQRASHSFGGEAKVHATQAEQVWITSRQFHDLTYDAN